MQKENVSFLCIFHNNNIQEKVETFEKFTIPFKYDFPKLYVFFLSIFNKMQKGTNCSNIDARSYFFSVPFFQLGKHSFKCINLFGLSAKIYFKYVFSELSGLIFSQFCISF